MTRRRLLTSLPAAALLADLASGGRPERTAQIALNLGGKHHCPFQNGFLPVLDSDLRTVFLLDAAGMVAASFRPEVPGAAVLGVRHIAVGPDRIVVAAAGARDARGRYGNFLIFSDLAGTPKRVVRTDPFAVFHPVFVSDGRLLCVGREIDDRLEEIEGYKVLRFYSPDGVLVEQAVPIDLLRPARRDPEPIEWDVAVAPGRIGMLDRERLRYVEFDDHGRITRPLTSLGFEEGIRPMGLALLASGGRLVAVEHTRGDASRRRFELYLIDDGGGHPAKRIIRSVEPPEGYQGFSLAGVHEGQVVLLTTPVGRMVFVPEAALAA